MFFVEYDWQIARVRAAHDGVYILRTQFQPDGWPLSKKEKKRKKREHCFDVAPVRGKKNPRTFCVGFRVCCAVIGFAERLAVSCRRSLLTRRLPYTTLSLNRVFADSLVGLDFLQSVYYINPAPTFEKIFCCGEKWLKFHF